MEIGTYLIGTAQNSADQGLYSWSLTLTPSLLLLLLLPHFHFCSLAFSLILALTLALSLPHSHSCSLTLTLTPSLSPLLSLYYECLQVKEQGVSKVWARCKWVQAKEFFIYFLSSPPLNSKKFKKILFTQNSGQVSPPPPSRITTPYMLVGGESPSKQVRALYYECL